MLVHINLLKLSFSFGKNIKLQILINRYIFLFLGQEKPSENFRGATSCKNLQNNFDNDSEEVSLRRVNGQQQLQPSKVTQNNLGSTNGITCPSCGDFFDSGKKRRLIDNCGHERCYTCMFNKGFCSLCNDQGINC